MIRVWKKSLLVQLVGSFSLLSLTIVGLMAYTAFYHARTSLKESEYERLTAVASLKEGELNRWMRDRRNTLVALSNILGIKRNSRILLTQEPNDPEYQAALDNLKSAFEGFIGDRVDYQEIFILSRSSRVIMSTTPERMGRYAPMMQGSQVNFSTVQQGAIANFYRSPETDRPTVTFTTPIVDEAGDSLGVLAVHLNLKRLDDIVGNNQGLGSSGETYLVANLGSNFANRNILLSSAAFGSDEYPEGVESNGITAAMSGDDGRGLYLSHQGRPVIGVYRWLEGQDVALIVEMDQSEAFAPARHLAAVIGLVGGSLAGLLTAGIILMGRRIVQPIRAIAQTAERMENRLKAGEIEALESAPILTENEIGTLARTFNQMVHQLQASYVQLQEYNLSLEAKVQARTQELSVKNEDLKATLSKLKATQMQLIQNEKMASLGQMVAGIAHEINNPVNFIFGNLKHLDEYVQNLWELIKAYEQEAAEETAAIAALKEELDLDFLKEDLPKMLNSIKLGTVRIREIVTSLRNFSRLDEAERKQADLHDGLDSTLLILQNRLKAKPNRPVIQIIKDYRCTQSIECYPSQLNQVFLNLLGNAIDALEPGAIAGENLEPTIHIRTALEGDYAVVAIADNGPGMPEKVRQKIFDPFFTTKEIGKGTGLGLSISYSIVVERHGGQLSCFSTPGAGAKFVITIPANVRTIS